MEALIPELHRRARQFVVETVVVEAVLLADPANIPPNLIPAVLSRLSALQTTLTTRLLEAQHSPEHSENSEALVDVDEASRRLATSKDWLYRHAKRLPFTVRVGRALRFSTHGIDRYIRQRQGR